MSGRKPSAAERVRDDVARLAREGLSRNRIARQLGCAPATVTDAARLVGVEFDRRPTAAAVQVTVLDAQHRRARLADRWFDVAEGALGRLKEAVDDDDPQAARAWATASAISTDKLLALAPPQSDDGDQDARLALTALMSAIRAGAPTDNY
ncbi:hypothetical protein [Nocardia sp. NPDC059239]|uniref:hypothetical protein n=1 Tax=unclassified Nocardia TaxID=2637762 RepID=UPI003689B12A